MKPIIIALYAVALFLTLAISFWGCIPPYVEVPCPQITRFLPEGAPYDSVIEVTGINFCPGDAAFHIVKIGDSEIPSANIDVVSAQKLKIKIPKGTPNGKISVALKTAPDCPAVSEKEFVYYYTASPGQIIAGKLNNNSCTDCFFEPRGIDINSNGDIIYVADRLRSVIRQVKITPSGVVMTLYAGQLDVFELDDDLSDGLFAAFNAPSDVAVDKNGNLYVADEYNNCIRKIDNSTRHAVVTISGDVNAGNTDNCALVDARYDSPYSIDLDQNGKLFVSELIKHRIRQLNMNSNTVTTIATGTSAPSETGLNFPKGLAFTDKRSPGYQLIVADQGNAKVRGVGTNQLFNIPAANNAGLNQPVGVTSDKFGNIFITDEGSDKLIVVYVNDEVRVLAGGGIKYTFDRPGGIVMDKNNSIIYVTDGGTHVLIKFQLE